MEADKPDRFAEKLPVVPDAVCFEFDVVGFCEVAQQIPRSVMVAPLSEVTFPPEAAVVWVMLVTPVVEETVGIDMLAVVNETCSAYPVPAELIA